MNDQRKGPHSSSELKSLITSLVAEVLNDLERRRKAIQEANEERERLKGKHPSQIISFFLRFWFTGRLLLPGWRFPVLLGVVATLLGLGIFFIFNRPPAPIPNAMVGVWRTPMPVYRDAGFRITPDSITIYTINGDSSVHGITDVELRREGRGRIYTILYTGGDVEYLISFLYSDVPAPSIRLRHPSDVEWRKETP